MKWVLLLFPLYTVGAILNFGAITAQEQWDCHNRWQDYCDGDMVAHDNAFAIFVGIFPPAWGAAFLITGAYAHGIQFSSKPWSTTK